MNVGSTFSGVGGFDLGFERAGMRVLWQAEIDEWCRRVLRGHWPDAAIYDDVRAVNGEAEPVDLLCGGFPCQDLSVAGKRAGFKGERSSLFFEFARIADELRPRWIVLENVVGLLSSAEGRDFGILLSTLAEIGYGCSWRVVDARYFGVPQRRRRVFIVGCLGDDGERAVRALGAGGEGNLAAGRCSWQNAAAGAVGGVGGVSGVIANTLQVTCGDYSRADGFNAVVEPAATGFLLTQTPITEHEGSPALGATSGGMGVYEAWDSLNHAASDQVATLGQNTGMATGRAGVVFPTVSFQLGNTKSNGSNVNTLDQAAGQGVLTDTLGSEIAKPLGSLTDGPRTTDIENATYVGGPSVRRLTPTECERLMGWPDGWTAVDGDNTPDGRRYAACGNGVVANVSEWIGRRIMAIEEES